MTALTIADLVGPVLTEAEMQARFPTATPGYVAVFTQWAESHWTAEGPNGDFYYDSTETNYSAAEWRGDPKYRERARAMLVPYRDGYLGASGNAAPAHWTFVVGLSCNALDEGETPENRAKSRAALTGLCAYQWIAGARAAVRDMTVKGWEGRIIGRILQCYLYGHLLGVTPSTGDQGQVGVMVEGTDMVACPPHLDVVRTLVKLVCAAQDPDGAWRAVSYCNQQDQFSAGILNDVLLEVLRHLGASEPAMAAMIRGFLSRAVGFLHTQWNDAAGGFRYISGPCPAAATDPDAIAADLSGLIVNPLAWYAAETGTPEDRAFALRVMETMAPNGQPQYGKQFNQLFSVSARSFAYLPAAVPVPRPALTPAQVKAALPVLDTLIRPAGRESKATKAALAPVAAYLHSLVTP